MRSFKTEGIVIRRRNVGEADRLLTVFTKHHGKITIKAKGVRKISSRRSGHIELLNLVSLSLYRGRVTSTLTEVETINNFGKIKDNLKSCGLAYHVCELIDSLCAENQENLKVYSLLCEVLANLSDQENLKVIISRFETELLDALGFISQSQYLNTQGLIEEIIERRLKAKRILPLLD
ncbi:MAG: DNA repair protein RecO [Candidatus Levybacteria bacterium]|nr:DNA repair protein RecO [Candidatus Levybacteria bacterium]